MNRRPSHPLRLGAPAFTLVEMLAATMLVAVLMAAVLMVLSAIGRDRRQLQSNEDSDAVSQRSSLVELLRWDLANASAMTVSDHGRALVLVGHGGLDARTFAPTGRLARIVYRVASDAAGPRLLREQIYLDDPIARQPCMELAACGVTRLAVIPNSSDGEVVHGDDEALSRVPGASGTAEPQVTRRVATRVHLRIEFISRDAIDADVWTR